MKRDKVDPFAALETTTPLEPVDAVPEVLAHRPSTAKRDRGWEKKQRKCGDVATYRGIPKHLQDEIRRISDKRNVPVGEVARALLEYALVAYAKGDLTLDPQFGPGKLTLYPS